ncbi:MAG: hypothetical protein IPI53_10295 [Saprospiraceae bacterium]|nr:hypothetical protein [Saprospiraceae bacterium]
MPILTFSPGIGRRFSLLQTFQVQTKPINLDNQAVTWTARINSNTHFLKIDWQLNLPTMHLKLPRRENQGIPALNRPSA